MNKDTLKMLVILTLVLNVILLVAEITNGEFTFGSARLSAVAGWAVALIEVYT